MGSKVAELPEHLRAIRDDAGDYFEPRQFGDDGEIDRFMRNWFSAKLRRMREPNLLGTEGDCRELYRMLVLPAFGQAVAIRVWEESPGVHRLATRVLSGPSGFGTSDLCSEQNRMLSAREWRRILSHLEDVGVWGLPTRGTHQGLDGTTYVLEAHCGGKRHVLERWGPDGGPFKRLARVLAKTAGLSPRRW